MEGAAWFGRNAVHITDRLSASVAQIISQLQMQRGSAEADDSEDAEMLLEDSLKQLSVCVMCQTHPVCPHSRYDTVVSGRFLPV